MAMDQAIYLWNNTQKQGSRMTPAEVFKGIVFLNYNYLHQGDDVWRGTVCILDPMLQDSKKLPSRWHPHACTTAYILVSQISTQPLYGPHTEPENRSHICPLLSPLQ
jgi:hypothetical protein